jgi:Zn-dependent protease with chaperone function
MALRGLWFDGRSSRAQPVAVALRRDANGPSLLLEPPGGPPLLLAAKAIAWPDAWSPKRPPRKLVIDLGGHGSLEVEDIAAWQAALQAAGHRASLAQRMQTRWTAFALVFLAAAVLLGAFYRWGTPWAAAQLTREVPLAWETGLAERALRELDAGWLKPSKLSAARQQELRTRFHALARQVGPELRTYGGYAPPLHLQFRSGMGPNAFALPGGTIVVTDAIVEEAARRKLGDDALLGVLAHEIGHVMHRHTTRLVVEQGVLNVGLGLALGDVSTVVASGSALLTGLSYRRAHESEADCFAVALLHRAGLSPVPMADLLLAIDAQAHGAGQADPRSAGRAWTRILSSHPDTAQRARLLQSGHAGGCH